MKKLLAITLSLFFLTNITFAAYNRYDYDDLQEKKSHKKLYYGIALTLIGGFLIYDGFSQVEVDVSKPSVDYTSVLHYEWTQNSTSGQTYSLSSGVGNPYFVTETDSDGTTYQQSYSVIPNAIYNTGNVDLYNVNVEVRYYDSNGEIINGTSLVGGSLQNDNYHTTSVENVSVDKNKFFEWTDIWEYSTSSTNPPKGTQRSANEVGTTDGVYLGENALAKTGNDNESGAMEIRVKLEPWKNYQPIYEKKNKCDIEGVAGILLAAAGVYFLLDYAFSFTKFNKYMKNNDVDFKLASQPSEYKLLFQKRL